MPEDGGAPDRVIVNVDGGARGNPGPAAIAAVVSTPEGEVIDAVGQPIGPATNNVADYRALLLGIERAKALGASEAEFVGDSELIVRQVRGEDRVKNEDLKPLHARAVSGLRSFKRWSIDNVPRAQNEAADMLVNETLD